MLASMHPQIVWVQGMGTVMRAIGCRSHEGPRATWVEPKAERGVDRTSRASTATTLSHAWPLGASTLAEWASREDEVEVGLHATYAKKTPVPGTQIL